MEEGSQNSVFKKPPPSLINLIETTQLNFRYAFPFSLSQIYEIPTCLQN